MAPSWPSSLYSPAGPLKARPAIYGARHQGILCRWHRGGLVPDVLLCTEAQLLWRLSGARTPATTGGRPGGPVQALALLAT